MATPSNLKTELRAHLLAAGPLTAIVGSKIRCGEADRDDRPPYVVIEQVDNVPVYDQQGPSGHEQQRVQIDLYADNPAQREALGKALSDAVDQRGRWPGLMGQLWVQTVEQAFAADDIGAAVAGDDDRPKRRTLQYLISYDLPS